LLFKGLKIGGWAAFLAITGYQLYKATPEQTPRVAAQAAGGLAGAALTTYLVCNVLLDIETAGWGLLICGLVAGGAGGYVGGEAAGAAYDKATETELDRAISQLSGQSRNERILFNLIVGGLGANSECVDANFVKSFLSIVPKSLLDYEAIILAGRLANVVKSAGRPKAGSPAPLSPASKSAAPASPEQQKGTICPNCHRENPPSQESSLSPQQLAEIIAAPSCSSLTGPILAALRDGVRTLPRNQRAPGDISHHRESDMPPTAPSQPGSRTQAFPTEEEQRGTVPCPNCHAVYSHDAAHDLIKVYGSRQLTDTERQTALDWLNSLPK
jgi:hypothetical protein